MQPRPLNQQPRPSVLFQVSKVTLYYALAMLDAQELVGIAIHVGQGTIDGLLVVQQYVRVRRLQQTALLS